MARIMVVEDELALRRSMRRRLEMEGHLVMETQSLAVAKRECFEHDVDAVVTDLNLGNENGMDLIHQLRADGYDGGIIVVTAYGSIENAVEAMRSGADEYLQKPISLEELDLIVKRTLERRRMESHLHTYEHVERFAGLQEPVVGTSDIWRQTLEMTGRAASAMSGRDGAASPQAVVLLLGEFGTGKELLARYIHRQASEGAAPFVHIKCYALPSNVMEEQLFGNSGEQSPAEQRIRRGLFETARGGTVFLDEIAEMSMPLQSRLMAMLQQRSERAGTSEAGARVVASTSQDLEKKVDAGAFRRDLYYSLNVLTIAVPPLREREEDVVALAEHFCTTIGKAVGRPNCALSAGALDVIREHSWPGNIHELRNVIHRSVLLSGTESIEGSDLGLSAASSMSMSASESHAPTSSEPVMARSKFATVTNPLRLRFDFRNGAISAEELEKALLLSALKETSGNISRAAKLVGMTRSGLRYRIERYGLRAELEGTVAQ